MHLAASLIALGSLAASAAAAAAPGYQYPDFVPLHKRQTSGPSYECHANCGYLIQMSKADKDGTAYCKNEKWLQYYHGCMKCAIKENIWNDYGRGVTAAVDKCPGLKVDLEGTGQPSGQSSAPATTTVPAATTPAQQTTSSAAQQPTTTATQQPPATQSSGSSTVPSTKAPSGTTQFSTGSAGGGVVVPTVSSSAPGHSSNSTAKPSSVTVSGGAQTFGSSLFVAGMAALVAAAWF
ncbi:hypothetical protein JDV02_004847 [Purpureocillium takamizusanense]|uniref:Uncharacterized protein n=1 Tax=Purpureocillium takamizusanense TaxID=2060973 RepID=A0A9Q8VB71_9HYPO|nr:uncharacterized protein JDV02_004847 [Purpureocillium takamizusanense]UNI18589.1 hypothetical protein JDV02_004847 [Purpureocillium takamizusanense]